MQKYKVGVVTSNRADYSPLLPLLKRIKNNKELDLVLFVTGSHLEERFGYTVNDIKADGFDNYIAIPLHFHNDSKISMGTMAGEALSYFTESFANKSIDLLIILGDRFEILSAAIAASYLNIPIAHISGGDVTTGAIDDSIRHSITKMSLLHFPGCEESKNRIIQMGENPNRVFNVGELGIENALNIDFYDRNKLCEKLNFKGLMYDYALVTFHPETKTNFNSYDIYELIDAMDKNNDLFYVITYSNFDAGGQTINEIWEKESKKRNNWLLVPSLGTTMYLSILKYSKLVLGNSSSGIIETPAFRIPTINIGNRQNGRIIANNILCCKLNSDEISSCIKKCFDKDFITKASKTKSPFGDGNSSKLIEKQILKFLHSNNKNTVKEFYDIKILNKESI